MRERFGVPLTQLRERLQNGAGPAAGTPLVRNGRILAASAVLAAGLGALFWLLAARWFNTETVGRSYALLSAAMLLATLGSLNLGDVLVRFLPTAGSRGRWLVVRCYTVATVVGAVVATGFVLLAPHLSPGLTELREPWSALLFVAATAAYTVFVLQDGALTGLRRPAWVLGENLVFAIAKALALAVCAALAVSAGILLSWAAGLALAVAVANVVLFARALPATRDTSGAGTARPGRMARYAVADYIGQLGQTAVAKSLPLLVLARLGAEQTAYYSLAYLVTDTLYQAAYAMGQSLTVEGAAEPHRLAEHAGRMLRHTFALIAPATAVAVAAAPWILDLFGPDYAQHGTTVLRLMALSAVPNVLFGVAVHVARVRQALVFLTGLQLVFACLLLILTLVLMPHYGLTGVGVAWLATACALALALTATAPRWLAGHPHRP
ncbi:lipopolysaccharide biosynthesis protein [Kitasatospora sp. DSM 101779]|uniref:lipopolysaccharide biosynthesis protein n=1 Tax=Kitasatospora sp. DSM 101779 TaxID=2853165 RepID=UPI0021DA60E6|nr:oligosaccharide flippase family protein [Kitasatospora sp. DSM 101779]MCU7827070.1 oligosaccharide flippase family protein [Kitasatospora sp. DSM 101779]